jgi:hypothetical protein
MKPAIKILLCAVMLVSIQACGTSSNSSPDVPSGPCKFNSQCGIGYLCIDGECFGIDAGPFIPGNDTGYIPKDGGTNPDGGGGKDGGVVESCSQGTCSGCCNQYSVCIVGTEDIACGQNNADCQDCTLNSFICKNHACVNPTKTCSLGTCTGCCDSFDNCQNGFSNVQCGKNGATCQDCTIFSQTCKSSSCSF